MDLFQMDFFVYILILMLFVGAFFVIYGSFTEKETTDSQDENEAEELLSLAQKLDTLESSVYEADEAVHMLGDMSKNVFKEFDSKYQELLFLYNLVDEKQKKLTLTGNSEMATSQNAKPDPVVVRDMLYSKGSTPPDAGDSSVPKRKVATVKRPVAVQHVTTDNIPAKLDVVVDDSDKNSGINPKFAHVLKLSRDGKSVEDIARELDMGKGEIMLILNLGGRRQNA